LGDKPLISEVVLSQAVRWWGCHLSREWSAGDARGGSLSEERRRLAHLRLKTEAVTRRSSEVDDRDDD
jgi:hypothetical protein